MCVHYWRGCDHVVVAFVVDVVLVGMGFDVGVSVSMVMVVISCPVSTLACYRHRTSLLHQLQEDPAMAPKWAHTNQVTNN